MKHKPIYYGEYLQLDKILGAQDLKSKEHGKEAHDETLFIIIHQTYELWFKQIIHELDSIYEMFNRESVKSTDLGNIIHRLNRIVQIQKILNEQLTIMETMTPLDFMDFRDYLLPASGFQSIQFRMLELKLGLRQKYRLHVDKEFFNSRLKDPDKKLLNEQEEKPTLLELVDSWLSRMPFGKTNDYDFWNEYQTAINQMLDEDEATVNSNDMLSEMEMKFEKMNLKSTRENYDNLFNEDKHKEVVEKGLTRLSREAKLSAIFIRLFCNEPILQIPNRILDLLIDIDEMFTTWRYRHSIMVHRTLGTKIGTGGSSGHEYLKNSTENNRVFTDFFNLATFLVPKTRIPKLPEKLKSELGFAHEE